MVPTCPVCESGEQSEVLVLPDMPVLINAQVRPHGAADVPKGDIELVVCHGCGHLYNRSFDDSLLDYDGTYENTLHYSPTFRDFAWGLVDRLIREHDLTGATVAELGSGPGHFLSMLCDRGVGRAFGYDPSYDPTRLGAPEHAAVTISTELFPADGSLVVDLALSQHVLEHLHDPVAALEAERSAVAASNGVVYSEVPNGALMLEQCALWDLIYEHLSYFVPTSFALAHARAGLAIESSGAAFGDQFMWADARPAVTDVSVDVAAVAAAVDAAKEFGAAARARIEEARSELVDLAAEGPVVLWGAGSKGATYLNLVHDVAPVAGVVDVNPRKDGWGVPGTSLTITRPDALTDIDPAIVMVANPVYIDEISARLAELDLSPAVRSLWG